MIRIWDGFLSLLAAAITIGIVGVPVWGSVLALNAGMVPIWGWGAVAALGFVGGIMMLAFLRKAFRGVHPLRDRRR
ncbi:MAG: hypothetical protein QNJ20_18850 [Paracoccaceae bacterium]|nr:hypothetical protein [Paracoccaceae bacterium]